MMGGDFGSRAGAQGLRPLLVLVAVVLTVALGEWGFFLWKYLGL